MNEGKTTAIFAAVAIVALGLAWWSKPAPIINEDQIAEGRTGQDVFPEFSDPESASSLQIAVYDEELAQLKRFEVARDQQSNLWTLPSHDDYPADAAEQVKDATTPLIALKVLSVETGLRSDHELYGVLNPDDEALAAGASGVGMLVTLKDAKDAVLASLIIGKEVEQVEGQRYVRIPTEDAVYKVELATNAFSTNFRDWIEGELLDVRSFDITRIGARDYELQQQSVTTMALKRNFDAEVDYDTSSSEWKLVSYQTYEGGAATPAQLAENESLNKEFLNSMRTAAQDLEIVDVKRKPTGLAADLKADESLLQNEESITSLQRQGFYPAGGPNGSTEIYAASGETIIGTNAGVRYVLRFGEVTASLSSLGESAGEDGGLSRYLLVTAQLDESKFPFPEIEVAPDTVEEMLAREKAESGEESGQAESEKTDDSPAESSESVEPASGDKVEAVDQPADPDSAAQDQLNDQAPAVDSATSEAASDGAATSDAATSDAGNSDAGNSDAGNSDAGNSDAGNSDAAGENTTQGTGASQDESELNKEAAANSSAEEKEGESTTEPEEPAADGGEPPVEAAAQQLPSNGEEAGTREKEGTDAPVENGTADQATESQTDAALPNSSESAETNPQAEQEGAKPAADAPTQIADAPTQGEKPAETQEELVERLEALREEIAKGNQRKIDERNEKMEEARKKVQELNARFSEWYYVVSDSEYNKLKLSRDNLIKAEKKPGSQTPSFSEGLNLPGLQPQLP